MLKAIGIDEVFLPKIIPLDHNFRSASVDFSEDAHLGIPASDLALLNQQDWYGTPALEAWEVANRHFEVLFFIAHREEIFRAVSAHFRGAIVWRAYGLDKTLTYGAILSHVRDGDAWRGIRGAGNRFWFGEAYAHLHEAEGPVLRERAVYLPLGLAKTELHDNWTGSDRRLYFVCPEIGFNPYYKRIYAEFNEAFAGFDFAIGGVQPIPVADPRVLGFVPDQQHQKNMRDFRVMFYHSREPNHIHYHPFEAIRAGMPLVYMAGGILDRFGGTHLPGRCTTLMEARNKIRRILDDDRSLIGAIRDSQPSLLEPMKAENCIDDWRSGFAKILARLESSRSAPKSLAPLRIAVILPLGYRGGTLAGAKALATAIAEGSAGQGEAAEVVLAYLDDSSVYSDRDFAELDSSIKRRPFTWKRIDSATAQRAMSYSGLDRDMPSPVYLVPDDGINQLMDCQLWVVVSDRLSEPLLPIRPYVLMVYDYLQRYTGTVSLDMNLRFFSAAREADRVFVTTSFTYDDAVQYAGLPARKVVKLPMLAPLPQPLTRSIDRFAKPYFVWPTNLGAHKNHDIALEALQIYYDRYGGALTCRITGVGTSQLFEFDALPTSLGRTRSGNQSLKRRIKVYGELHSDAYRNLVAGARFLFHPALADNGTFSVIEAATLGVPSLSSDYPAMREIDATFDIGLVWMDARDPEDIAKQLVWMENNPTALARPTLERTAAAIKNRSDASSEYWAAIRECL